MLTFLVKATRIFLSAILTLTSVFSPLTGKQLQKIERKNEGCKASFAIISDTHLQDNFFLQGLLEFGLQDMSEAKDKLDAFVICGDITDHGYIPMWDRFAKAMSKYEPAEQTILVIGNHDTWGPERENPELTRETFIKYNNEICGRDIDNVYYSTTINGCPAIVLGSEGDALSAVVSQEQVDWFAVEMEKASQTGLPIFVFMHQSVNGTHGLPYNWDLDETDPPDKGGIGDRSDDILNIIKQYKNVFYMSGHIHAAMANEDSNTFYTSVEKYDGYTLVNIPCYMYPNVKRGGYINNGMGFVFEVYENEVLLRARNFTTGRWITKYDETIELV